MEKGKLICRVCNKDVEDCLSERVGLGFYKVEPPPEAKADGLTDEFWIVDYNHDVPLDLDVTAFIELCPEKAEKLIMDLHKVALDSMKRLSRMESALMVLIDATQDRTHHLNYDNPEDHNIGAITKKTKDKVN